MNVNENLCPNCGSSAWRISEKIGSIEIWSCGECHYEDIIHIYEPMAENFLPRHLGLFFELTGYWQKKPLKECVEKVIEIVPALRQTQPSAIIRGAIKGAPLALGKFTDQEAKKIEPILLSLGLFTKRTLIPRN